MKNKKKKENKLMLKELMELKQLINIVQIKKEFLLIIAGFVMVINKLILNGHLEFLDSAQKNQYIFTFNMKIMHQDTWEK